MSYYDKTKLGRIISRCTSDVERHARSERLGNLHDRRSISLHDDRRRHHARHHRLAAVSRRRLARARALLRQPHLSAPRRASMWQTVREGWTRVSTNMAENITGMRVVTAFNRQVPNLGVFNRLQDDNTNNNVDVARINGVYQPLLELIDFIGKVDHPRLRRLPDRHRPHRRKGVGAVVAVIPVLGLVHEPDHQLRQLLQHADAGDGRRRARLLTCSILKPDVHGRARRQAAAAHRRPREIRARHLRLQPRPPGAARHQLRSPARAR